MATVAVAPNPNAIEHRATRDGSTSGRRSRAGTSASVVTDIDAKLEGGPVPRGYHAEVLGEYKERQSAQRRLLASPVSWLPC